MSDQTKQGRITVSWIKFGFGKGTKGGSIYPQNCHHTSPARIDYVFPNANSSDTFKDCQVAIEYIEVATANFESLVKACKYALENSNQISSESINIQNVLIEALKNSGSDL